MDSLAKFLELGALFLNKIFKSATVNERLGVSTFDCLGTLVFHARRRLMILRLFYNLIGLCCTRVYCD